jgi:hypothetical protein
VARPQQLFDKIVELSGLSSIIGPGTVRRALADAGFDVARATADCYRSILSRLEARLRAYLSAREVTERIRSISEFLTTLLSFRPSNEAGAEPGKEDQHEPNARTV